MTAVFYLLTAFLLGYILLKLFFPELEKAGEQSFAGNKLMLNSWLITLPASFLFGTVLLSWGTYFAAYACRNTPTPLMFGNVIALFSAYLIILAGTAVLYKKKNLIPYKNEKGSLGPVEIVMLVIAFAIVLSLMFVTLFHKDGNLYVGISVFSDFSPHLGMIRSFSTGSNFPTVYSHYAGADIKYHFMFQFLVGNLEFLGMRLDLAMNIPSILGMMGTISLLYVLAVKLSGKKMAGWMTVAFFLFRSSKSLFSYIAELSEETDVIETLLLNKEFIGYTNHENWGLWNLNVYCNQRHLGFVLPALLIALILFIPRLYDMKTRYSEFIKKEKEYAREFGREKKKIAGITDALKFSLFSAQGWRVDHLRLAVATGLMLGSVAFFNGAVLIATLLILFVLAIASDNRIEFLIVAMLSMCLSFLQSGFFIDGSAVSPSIYYGFLADRRTLFGTMDYVIRLLGLMPFLVLMGFLVVKGVRKYILIAFSAPFIFAFFVSLTPDIAVNHKYIMIAVMLMNIYVAILIAKLFEQRVILMRSVCILLIVIMTATGIYDYTTVIRRNDPDTAFVFSDDDYIINWVMENSDSKDIFLTSNYSLSRFVMGGAALYDGWQYFAWSAGYDTVYRDQKVREMYEADTPELLDALVTQENIRFIVVDHDNRFSTEYAVNERNIQDTYKKVMSYGTDEWETAVYDTRQKVFQ